MSKMVQLFEKEQGFYCQKASYFKGYWKIIHSVVKPLALAMGSVNPEMESITLKQAANYYEVDSHTIEMNGNSSKPLYSKEVVKIKENINQIGEEILERGVCNMPAIAEKVVGMDGNKFRPELINGKKKEQKLTKAGTLKQTPNNTKVNREYVMPFKEEDIQKMIEWFDRKIMCAGNDEDKEIAVRNKYLFIIGCNLGLRVSDLCSLTWNDVFDNKGNLRESKIIKPWKTRNINKHIDQEFNDTFRKAIVSYIKENKISVNIDRIKESIYVEKKLSIKLRTLNTMEKSIKKAHKYTEEDVSLLKLGISALEEQYEELIKMLYVFPSREGGHIEDGIIRKMIKDGSKACKINYNTSTHSLRKTYARTRYEKAEDKTDELIQLMNAFGHTSEAITLKYIGVMKEKNRASANRVNIGLEVSDEEKEDLKNFQL